MRQTAIAMLVIVIGAALLVPWIARQERARAERDLKLCVSNLMYVVTAVEMYSVDNAGRFPKKLDQMPRSYVKSIPTCPAVGYDTMTAGYASVSNPDFYTLLCTSGHQSLRLDPGSPQYASTLGLKTGYPGDITIFERLQSEQQACIGLDREEVAEYMRARGGVRQGSDSFMCAVDVGFASKVQYDFSFEGERGHRCDGVAMIFVYDPEKWRKYGQDR